MKISWSVRAKLFSIAKETGPSGVARCAAGVRIAEIGASEVLPDGSVIVRAPGKAERKITKGRACPCDDVKFNKPADGRCKHIFAANAIVLALREAKLQTPAAPVA